MDLYIFFHIYYQCHYLRWFLKTQFIVIVTTANMHFTIFEQHRWSIRSTKYMPNFGLNMWNEYFLWCFPKNPHMLMFNGYLSQLILKKKLTVASVDCLSPVLPVHLCPMYKCNHLHLMLKHVLCLLLFPWCVHFPISQ